MNRKRTESPVYARQWSGGSSSTGSSSPVGSPAHPRSRLPPAATGMSTIKRTQNVAAKAAAQRLALVMASKPDNDEDDEDDDLGFRFGPPPPMSNHSINRSDSSNSNSGGVFSGIGLSKPNRSPSPAVNFDIPSHWWVVWFVFDLILADSLLIFVVAFHFNSINKPYDSFYFSNLKTYLFGELQFCFAILFLEQLWIMRFSGIHFIIM